MSRQGNVYEYKTLDTRVYRQTLDEVSNLYMDNNLPMQLSYFESHIIVKLNSFFRQGLLKILSQIYSLIKILYILVGIRIFYLTTLFLKNKEKLYFIHLYIRHYLLIIKQLFDYFRKKSYRLWCEKLFDGFFDLVFIRKFSTKCFVVIEKGNSRRMPGQMKLAREVEQFHFFPVLFLLYCIVYGGTISFNRLCMLPLP